MSKMLPTCPIAAGNDHVLVEAGLAYATGSKPSSAMAIRYSCSHDDSKNPGTTTDFQKDSVFTPGSPSFLNRCDLTLLFAINL